MHPDTIFSYPFMVNAFRAGALAAVLAATIGWFAVLRGQTFAAHTLSLVGFPGAAGAILIGVSQTAGFYAFCIGAAIVIALLPGSDQRGRFSDESAGIGSVQAFLLACGFLFVTLYRGNLNGLDSLLFGSFLGITPGQVATLAIVTAASLAALAWLSRPLFFSSVEPDVAAAAGVPVRALSLAFLILLGVATAATSQITGSLLVFSLIVVPPAAAQALALAPGASVALAAAIAVFVTWAGLVAAYYSSYPTGAFVASFSFAVYLIARVFGWARSRTARAAETP